MAFILPGISRCGTVLEDALMVVACSFIELEVSVEIKLNQRGFSVYAKQVVFKSRHV